MLSRPSPPSATPSEVSSQRSYAPAVPEPAQPDPAGKWTQTVASGAAQVTVEVGGELAEQLLDLARAQGQPAESLAADMVRLGLQHAGRRRRAEDVLASLTPRQSEVARLAAGGRTNRQIARELWLSPETVKTHLRRTLERFDLHSKSELRLLLVGLDGDPLRDAKRDPLRDPEDHRDRCAKLDPLRDAKRKARLPGD